METTYKNLGYVFLLFIPLTFIAFYKTYFGIFPNFEEGITSLTHIHALVASIWIGMLIAQPILIKKKQFVWHKRIGKWSYFIFPLLILTFISQMGKGYAAHGFKGIYFPLADSILLVTFYTLAVLNKKKTPKHMRFMIGAAMVFLGPTIGRIGPILLGLSIGLTQNLQYTIIYLILLGLVMLDRKKNRDFKPYLFIGGMWLLHQIAFNLLFFAF